MKSKNVSFVLMALAVCIGCNDKPTPTNNLLPEEVSESSFSLLSKGRQNMVDHIYYNCVDTNVRLTQLHNKMEAVEKKYNEWVSTYNKYQHYAQSYSDAAKQLVRNQQFLDTMIKQNTLIMIGDFEEKHKKRIAQLVKSKDRIDHLYGLMQDKMVLLKLAVTLPIINQYLDRNLPNNSVLNEITNDYESLLNQLEEELKINE